MVYLIKKQKLNLPKIFNKFSLVGWLILVQKFEVKSPKKKKKIDWKYWLPNTRNVIHAILNNNHVQVRCWTSPIVTPPKNVKTKPNYFSLAISTLRAAVSPVEIRRDSWPDSICPTSDSFGPPSPRFVFRVINQIPERSRYPLSLVREYGAPTLEFPDCRINITEASLAKSAHTTSETCCIYKTRVYIFDCFYGRPESGIIALNCVSLLIVIELPYRKLIYRTVRSGRGGFWPRVLKIRIVIRVVLDVGGNVIVFEIVNGICEFGKINL